MKNSARSASNKVKVKKEVKIGMDSLNSRVFLASSQCLGERSNYLFAFGAEV
ncbi:MAG: hypothetical protein ABJF11_18050 [Reichenbachiella sp.]|uniref:hypothetical protein n=1 Tax=Reichenbachiella sp. TaxID=2184521 RepID=UPI003262CDAD